MRVSRSRRSGRRVVEIFERDLLKRMFHDAFERADHVVVFRRDERECVASALGTSCTSDAVDVGIGGIGHVEVDDVRDAVHIQATRGDVGGNHDLVLPVLEAVER